MDSVYKFYDKHASQKIHIKEYFDQYKDIINFRLPIKYEKNDIACLMGAKVGEHELDTLTSYCSVDTLTVEGELPKMANNRKMRKKKIFDPPEPSDLDLQAVKYLKHRVKQKAKPPPYKYQSELFINYEKVERKDGDQSIIPGEDILVYIRVYHPFIRGKTVQREEFGSVPKVDKVIAILGSQSLADLRDKITCMTDYSISKECSENLDNAIGPMAKDVYKSGFIYIEDTFYNDTRCPTNIDYSEVIIEWAKRRPEIGPFNTAVMENTRIDSLSVRFGYPWVYKHQGDCEHLIVFSDARLVNRDDELAVSAYPRIVRLRPTGYKYCMICGLYSAKWITMNNEGIPHNPCYFCDTCFESYHYVDGEKIGNFEAYAYPQNVEATKVLNELKKK